MVCGWRYVVVLLEKVDEDFVQEKFGVCFTFRGEYIFPFGHEEFRIRKVEGEKA